jgi:hypothetical protein
MRKPNDSPGQAAGVAAPAVPAAAKEKTTWPLDEFTATPGVHVLCRGQTYSAGQYGIVTVAKQLFAFHSDGDDAVELVPVNFWEDVGAPVRVCRLGPSIDSAIWSAGRWTCMYPGCMTHGGLLHATECVHVRAAELVEWHGWNHDPE